VAGRKSTCHTALQKLGRLLKLRIDASSGGKSWRHAGGQAGDEISHLTVPGRCGAWFPVFFDIPAGPAREAAATLPVKSHSFYWWSPLGAVSSYRQTPSLI